MAKIGSAALRRIATMLFALTALTLCLDRSLAHAGDGVDATATIEDMVRDHDRIDGLFTFFRDKNTGALLLEIATDQIGKEFVYHPQTLNGPADAGFRFTKGTYNSEYAISIRRRFNKVEFVQAVTGFHIDPTKAIARAAGANLVPAILVVAEIKAISEDGTRLLIEADPVFQTEALLQISQSPFEIGSAETVSLGSLSADKTSVLAVRSFPQNSDVIVAYTYETEAPSNFGGSEVADARNISITVQHSFIEMPDDNYQPRLDDQRVGYFSTPVTELGSTDVTPYRDMISRWRLEKKDPAAAISEPVKPITFWIENTTPVEYRTAVRRGVLTWNEAFKKIGFQNAVEVQIQPDDATWDASDVRYNVLRWVASPQPLYGGFAPCLTNPRTGEILAADIMLEFNAITKRMAEARAFASDPSLSEAANEKEIAKIVQQGIQGVVVHEVGHALGLMHNMKASQMLSLAELSEASQDLSLPHVGSVMDYDPLNYSRNRSNQGNYCAIVLGPYDQWAIEFGYHPKLDNSEEERIRNEVLLAQSTRPELAFANDADSIFPSMGIDPEAMPFDLSSDAISFSVERIEIVNEKLDGLVEVFGNPGDTWDGLRSAYQILLADKATSSKTISRYVGGVNVKRSVIGQPGEEMPLTPVSYEDQKRAMAALAKHIFAPDAFYSSPELLQRLQMKRRGEERLKAGGETEDLKIHDLAFRAQAGALRQLLHPIVLKRVTDSGLYGNKYSAAQMMGELTEAIFAADLRKTVNSFRQNLQVHYVEQLVDITAGTSGHDQIARSAADHNLRKIGNMMETSSRPDVATTAHRDRLQALVNDIIKGTRR